MEFSLSTMAFDGKSKGFCYAKPFAWPEKRTRQSMWRFRERFPFEPKVEPVSLGEGGTPLLKSRLIPEIDLFWKDETRNPTGSHKDRALAIAATHARTIGAKTMAVVSAGSTGIANAAYAARAGLNSITLMSGGTPFSRTYPVFAFGSRLIELDANIDQIIAALESHNGQNGLYVCSTTRSSNAYQAEGPKTIAYEIVEDLGTAPDWVVVPTGGGGTVSAVWRGFAEFQEAGLIGAVPRFAAVVPKAYNALAIALAAGIDDVQRFNALPYRDDVATVLTKLSHPHPPDGVEALAALRASGGTAVAVSDDDALDAVAMIGARDGLYLEPSSAVVLPALKELIAGGDIRPRQRVVALACGSGFRETFIMEQLRPSSVTSVRLDSLESLLLSEDDEGD
jgi:threonine synthase